MYIQNCLLTLSLAFFAPQIAVGTGVPGGHCPHYINDEIQQCVQPVAQYAKVLNQKNSSSPESESSQSEFGQALQLPKLGGQVFKELCRLIRNFEQCVAPHRKKCTKHITINLIEASYGFLCNAGYDTFMNSAECLMELDQRPSVKHCHDETLRDIEKANGEADITMPAKLDRMCEALNFFSGCVRHPIRHNCGLEAWQVIFRVLKDTTKTLMPACQFTGTSAKITPAWAQQRKIEIIPQPDLDSRRRANEARLPPAPKEVETNFHAPKTPKDSEENENDDETTESEEWKRQRERTAAQDQIRYSQLEGEPDVSGAAGSSLAAAVTSLVVFSAMQLFLAD